jgi:hypothetical protein
MIDLDELTAALAGPKPDRGDVLASFRRKHRRRKARQRLLFLSAVAVGVTATIALATSGPSRPRQSVTLSAKECTPVALAHSLAQARQSGASILIADESPTDRTAGSGYAAVVLHSVRTLSGPVVTSGTIAWTDGTAIGGAGPAPRTTGATADRVFAIAWPAALVGSAVGPVLRAAPVVDGNVMFTTSGCTHAADLPGSLSSGSRTATAGGAQVGGADSTALYAVPLQTVEEAAVSPPGDSNEGGHQANPTGTAPGQGGDHSRGNGTGNAGNDNQGSGTAAPSAAPPTAAPPSAPQGAGGQGAGGQGGHGQGGRTQGSGSQGAGNGNGQGNESRNAQGSYHGRGKAGHQ